MKKITILVLHGWGLSGKVFAPLTKMLTSLGYKVYAPDMPGFGLEAAPTYAWRLRDYVNFVDRYIDKKQLKNVVIIGHSFGGRVALRYAQLFGKKILGLVLTGTPGFTPVPRKRLFLFIALAKVGNVVFSIPPLSLFRDWVRRWYYYVVGAKDFFRAEGTMRETFKYVVQEELVSAMVSIRLPVLLIWGEYDIIVPPSIARQMKDVLYSATLHIIPESDHGVPFKRPEIFVPYVDRFVRSL